MAALVTFTASARPTSLRLASLIAPGMAPPPAVRILGELFAAMVPELPTIAEAGVAGYQATSWLGLLAPAGTPSAVTINADVSALLSQADSRERLASDGAEPEGTSPQALGALLRKEIAKWGKVIRAAGIAVQCGLPGCDVITAGKPRHLHAPCFPPRTRQ